VRCDSPRPEEGMRFLETLVKELQKHPGGDGTRVVGPLQAPMARRAGLYRCHVVVTGPSRRSVQARMSQAVAIAMAQRTPSKLRWFVDIDPIEPL
jgi:primosomal protein N' (replication factor Y)